MIQSILLSLVTLFASGEGTKDVYTVDTNASSIKWLGEKVTGEHTGTINLKEGDFTFEDGKLVAGTFTVDMTTLSNEDLSGDSKGRLEGHLKSDDFFGVANFPTSKFEITRAVPQGPGKYKIIGNMTIKETTEEIQFPATLEEKDGKLVGSADIVIDRSKYDIRYGSGSFFDNLGDKTIYDNFTLTVNIVGTK